MSVHRYTVTESETESIGTHRFQVVQGAGVPVNITIEGGGGGGAVDSVNGETGVVVLTAADVGAATTAQGTKADTAVQPADLTPYATDADLTAHTADTTAVHGIADTTALVLTNDARLTDARTPTGAAGGVLGGTYPNPSFAADMATQAELDAHAADTTSVHGIADTSTLETTTGAQAKVDAAIAALINSAPGALDTLDELAAALGDDANFAATVTAALAGKQPLDSDLTAIAALTTSAFGRGFLDLADAAAARTKLALGTMAVEAAADYVAKALYDANTILAATSDNTPTALTVAASRIVGRKATGDIAAMTGAETYALLTRTREVWYSVPGALTAAGGAVRIPFPRAATITNVAAVCGTAPTGAAILVDVNKNGTTIFTTQGNRPNIAVSTNADNSSTPDVTSIAANDYLTVDVDQIGSTVAGSDLTVRIDYTETG